MFSTGLTPTINSDPLPATLASGTGAQGDFSLGVTNSGSTTEAGYTATIVASLDQTVDSNDVVLGSAIRSTQILPGRTSVVLLPATVPTTLAVGTYYIIAEVEDSSDNINTMVAAKTLVIAGGGGGGGGGGTATGLTPTIPSLTLPAAVVAGATLHGAIKVDLANSGSATEKGYTVNVYASLDQTLDTSVDQLVTTTTKGPAVKAGKTGILNIPITKLPAALANGTYYLIVQTVDSASNTDSASSASTVTVAAPFVALSDTLTTTLPAALVSGTAAKGSVTLLITNNGNVQSKGSTGINITASTASGTLGTTIIDLPKTLIIPPGKTGKAVVQIKSIPELSNDNYFIVAQVTDPFAGGTSIASSASTIDIAAPFITLSATLGPVTKQLGDTLTITNSGNVADDSKFTGTLAFSFNSDGTGPVGSTAPFSSATLNILPGKSGKIVLTGWKSILSGLVNGVPYFLTLTAADATSNSIFAVSSTSFTL